MTEPSGLIANNGLLTPPKGVSEKTYRSVVAAATSAYAIYRRVPTMAEIKEFTTCQEKRIMLVLQSPEFKQLMGLRGMPFDSEVRLTAEQYYAIQILTNPTDRRPMDRKLKSAGITYHTYRAWLKQPLFRDYIAKISEDMLGEHVADVHTKVVEKAAGGDVQFARLFYELNGRHDPGKQQMLDVQALIGLLIEVFSRHVRDVGILHKVTADIEKVLNGENPNGIRSFDMDSIVQSEVVESPIEAIKAIAEKHDVGTPIGNFLESYDEDFDPTKD